MAAMSPAVSRPLHGGAAEGERERLELEDFEVAPGAAFDPVRWLNARLARGGVSFDRLDHHLPTLAMRCQLLCQDTSKAIEDASGQLAAQLPSSGRDLERMREQALQGHDRLGRVLHSLQDSDDRKRSGLQGLAELDAVKTRVETASSALKEVGSWERKVRDCEQLVNQGKLPAALAQVGSLKGVLNAFRMLPEYGKKEAKLKALEENLLATAQRRARQAVERNVVADLAACVEVFAATGQHQEASAIAEAVFVDVVERAWKAQEPGGEPSAAALSAAVRAGLEATAQAFRERWPLLQSLDEAAPAPAPDPAGSPAAAPTLDAAAPGAGSALVCAARAALGALGRRLEPCLAASGGAASEEEATAHLRASRAVALLADYSEGLSSLAQCAPMVETPSLWTEVCKDPGALPWGLLSEVALFVVWRPMQDDATALQPPAEAHIRSSEAVLAAESNAKKLMQMPSTWARYLEEKGASRLAPVWLACVDATCAEYWGRWDGLLGRFQGALASSHDSTMLHECMQLHGLLHDALPAQFAAFKALILQLAAKMLSATESSFGAVLSEKLRDPAAWCERLATPSAEALRAAQGALENLWPDAQVPAALASKAFPLSGAALSRAEAQARGLVTQCCVQPVSAALAGYAEAQEWTRPDPEPMAGGLSASPSITHVGEHLFALMPQLGQSQPDAADQTMWLPEILDAVVEAAAQKVLLIRQLTPHGAAQLREDLEYLLKLAEALGGAAGAPAAGGQTSGVAAGRLRETLTLLGFLSVQQRRQRECASKGDAFREAAWEGPAPPRRLERALRAAMGLPAGAV